MFSIEYEEKSLENFAHFMIDENRGALSTMETMALEIYHLVGAHYHSSTWLLKLDLTFKMKKKKKHLLWG